MDSLGPSIGLADRSTRRPSATDPPPRVHDWDLVERAAESRCFALYRARPADTPHGRPATHALKLVRAEWEADHRVLSLLRREAVVGYTVSHPHVLPVLAGHVSKPPFYLVTPWLEGVTLQQRIAAAALMDLPEALWVARQVGEALGALDCHGWCHGDLKPSNVHLSGAGHATLLDFGFARRHGEFGSVADRLPAGTPNYLAPELALSTWGADVRSDIYSLGVMLFEMLSGRLPLEANDVAELAALHLHNRPPDLRRLVPHLPPPVVRLIQQMLAKDPLRRPQTHRELIHRLAALEIATFTERSTY